MRTRYRAPRRPRAPRGLTIVEALVALLVLAVGILALIGSTAQLVRVEHATRDGERAAQMLGDRLESTAALPCSDSSGVTFAAPFVERWRRMRVDDVTTLADTVRYVAPGSPLVSASLTTPVRCRP
jgi:Tfp pilus assembly protein PilV